MKEKNDNSTGRKILRGNFLFFIYEFKEQNIGNRFNRFNGEYY